MYVCAKCVGGGELAGLCLACSLHCHDGHQLYELYTKRSVNGGASLDPRPFWPREEGSGE